MSVICVVVLTYIKPIEEVDTQITAHMEWLHKGYEDGIFLASGRRIPRNGGVILAKGDNPQALQERINQDPFLKSGVAKAEIIPFDASLKADFLQDLL